jgi:hypothetical protein
MSNARKQLLKQGDAGMTEKPYNGPHKESVRGLGIIIKTLKSKGFNEGNIEIKRLLAKIDELKQS